VSQRIERGLPTIGVRREVRVAGIRIAGRRRRPSGEKAPLERELRATGRIWLVAGIAMIAVWITLFAFPATTNWWTRHDISVLRRFVDARNDTLTSIADAVALLGSSFLLRVLRIGTLLALVFIRRWRHFFAVILAILIVQWTVDILQEVVGRPRPFVSLIGTWEGASHPSGPVARFGVTLAAMAYALVPRGKRRRLALVVAGGLVALLVLAQLYLGVDHPSDAIVSAIFSISVVVVLFPGSPPNRRFPFIGSVA